MKSVKLITRADDAGLNRTVNRAVYSAAKKGIVRNISLMAAAPEIEDAAEVLLDLADTIDFGLHVTLTSEWSDPRWGPCADPAEVKSLLLEDGTFPGTCSELAELSPNPEEMMREVQVQYDTLTELGFKPAYVDEHMGIGQVADLHQRLSEFARQHDLVYDRTIRESQNIGGLPGWDGPGEHPGTELADHLSQVAPGTYLLVGHPATKSDEMRTLRLAGNRAKSVMMERNRQRRMFMDIEIVDYCENVGIELLRYSQIGRS